MAFPPMNQIVTGHGTSSWDPFKAAGNAVGAGLKARNRYQFFKDAHDAARNEEQPQSDTVAQQETPTPGNTGAPVPGYRQRGSHITPESTGAPVPGTLKQTPVASGNITPKHTKAYPKKQKQTAPGTRPKKK